MTHALEPREKEINSRLDGVGWGTLLVILGFSALAGTTSEWAWFSEHGWMIAVGLLLLGINAYRLFVGLQISWFTTVLGAFAVAGGVADLTGVDLPVGPALLVAIGAAIVYAAWSRRDTASTSGG